MSILSEIGEAMQSGDGLVSVTWGDILAWSEMTGSNLTPGESEAIRFLSAAYVALYYESRESGCLAPNIERLKDREIVAGKMKSLFAMLRG